MSVPSFGDGADGNKSIRNAGWLCLRLDLVPDAWSGSNGPGAETVSWIEDVWCGAIELCPVPDPRLMSAGPD